MRLLAALCLLGVSAFYGYAKAYALEARTAALDALIQDITQLLLRMDYETLPIGALASSMSRKRSLTAPLWAAFAERLAQAGTEEALCFALSEKAPYGLLREDISLFRGLGNALGCVDAALRQKAAAYIVKEAERRRDILRKEQANKGKLYGTLGLLFGLAAAILVI